MSILKSQSLHNSQFLTTNTKYLFKLWETLWVLNPLGMSLNNLILSKITQNPAVHYWRQFTKDICKMAVPIVKMCLNNFNFSLLMFLCNEITCCNCFRPFLKFVLDQLNDTYKAILYMCNVDIPMESRFRYLPVQTCPQCGIENESLAIICTRCLNILPSDNSTTDETNWTCRICDFINPGKQQLKVVLNTYNTFIKMPFINSYNFILCLCRAIIL